MSRAIDADALIDDLKHDVAVDQDSLDYEELTDSNREKIQFDKDCKQNAIDLLQNAPTIEPEPHWIPCSEKLPEANGRYLVTRGLVAAGALWNRVYIANYSNLMGIKSVKIWWQGNVGKSDFERLDDVLAWMPLPEPYAKRRTDESDANT